MTSPKLTINNRNSINFRIPALSQSILNNHGWWVSLVVALRYFSEASKLLASITSILPVASIKGSSFVVRNVNGARPYFVFQQDNGKVVGEECERYKSAKVCYHSVAVAEKCGTVEKFISWKKEVRTQLLLGVS